LTLTHQYRRIEGKISDFLVQGCVSLPASWYKTDMTWQQRELARRQQLVGNMLSKVNEVDETVTEIEPDRIVIHRSQTEQKAALLETERSEAQLKPK
jgi:hypothetical protein